MARNYIVIDTETAPTVNHTDNKAHPETSLVYDMGWVIVDGDSGAILIERSYLIADVAIMRSKNMQSAYYGDKMPSYWEGIRGNADGDWFVTSFLDAYKQFKKDIIEYNVKDIWAYNARFDQTALNNTIETLSNGYARWFKPYKCRFRDVWDYASNITGTKKYVDWCKQLGYVSEKGNPNTGAEYVYRFIADDIEFIESHTALDDAKIEAEILRVAKRKHKKTRHSMGQGWRDAAKIAKE